MMHLDVHTLLVVTALNLLTVSVTLPMLMGNGVSRSARFIQGSLLSQMMAWMLTLASEHAFDQAFSTAAVVFNAVSQWMLFRALSGWLGPRWGERLLLGLMVAAPLGYAIGFSDSAFRMGWAHGLLGLQMLIVAGATTVPRMPAARKWRWLLHASGAGCWGAACC